MAKTVIGLFDNFREAQDTVREMVNNGFARENISLVANDTKGEYANNLKRGDTRAEDAAASGAGLGAALGGMAGLLVGLGTFMIPGVGPVLAAGPLIAALGGAGIGAVTGGLVGALTESGVPDQDASIFVEGVRRGATLVVAYVSDDSADLAADIMNRNNPIDIEERGSAWRHQNWARSEENAEPFAFDRTRQTPSDTPTPSRREPSGRVRLYETSQQRSESANPGTTSAGYEDRAGEDWRMYESRFRDHYQSFYSRMGDWEDFRHSYRYGFEQGRGSFANSEWEVIRDDLRQEWETLHRNQNWFDHEEAVRQGWLTGRTPR
jgi:hypothetical protein